MASIRGCWDYVSCGYQYYTKGNGKKLMFEGCIYNCSRIKLIAILLAEYIRMALKP